RQLLTHRVRAACDDETLVHQLLPGEILQDLASLRGELGESAVLDGVHRAVARRIGEGRKHVQAPVEEVETMLGVKLLRLAIRLRHADDLGEGCAIGRLVLAALGHALPVAVEKRLAAEVAEEGEVGVVVVEVETEVPRLDGAAPWNVDGGMWLLDGLGPAVDPAE